MLELYLRGRSMRIIEFIKRLFHREKPIEIKHINVNIKMYSFDHLRMHNFDHIDT